jgi:curved DNA-binding protein CbpA
MAKTLYNLFGVQKDATPEAIKEAYVKHAARLRSSGATAEAQVLKQAFEVLSDPRLRARYDQQLHGAGTAAGGSVGGTVGGAIGPDPDERHWLFSWRGALFAALAVVVVFFSWSYHQREQTRIRLDHERAEAERFAAEQRRAGELRQLEAERRGDEERRRKLADTAAAQRATQGSRGETLYRDTLQHQRDMQNDRLQLLRDRDAARQEDLERRRIDLENQRQLARDKRLARELEQTSPRRF